MEQQPTSFDSDSMVILSTDPILLCAQVHSFAKLLEQKQKGNSHSLKQSF
jgi:hypothetical protein